MNFPTNLLQYDLNLRSSHVKKGKKGLIGFNITWLERIFPPNKICMPAQDNFIHETFHIKSWHFALKRTSRFSHTFFDRFYVIWCFWSKRCCKYVKVSCSKFKGWNQLNHQPVLKLPHFFPGSLQAKTAGISKLVNDEADSSL